MLTGKTADQIVIERLGKTRIGNRRRQTGSA
jgi:hypothetical protein